MIKFSGSTLFVLVLCITLAGCSKISTANGSITDVQDRPAVKFSADKVTVMELKELSPLKEGTRVEIGWAYPYIRYDGQFYQIILDKPAKKSRVGRQIGKVERFLPSSMVISDKPFIDKDGDSNYLTEGSVIYEFKGKDVNKAIIVDDRGVFKEAVLYSN